MLDKIWGGGKNFRTVDGLDYLYFTLRNIGMRPPESQRRWYRLYASVLFFIICVVAPVTFIAGLVPDEMTTSQILSLMQAVFNVYGVPIKAITLALSMPRLESVMPDLTALDERCKFPEEHKLLRNLVMVCNRLMVFVSVNFFIYFMSSFIFAFAYGHPVYGVNLFVVDWRNSKEEFYLHTAAEFTICFWCIYFQVGHDTYPCIYMFILRTHLRILVLRVQRIGTDSKISKAENRKELIRCVADHERILKLCGTISPVISVTVFIQYFVCACIMGVTLINIMLFADNGTKIGSAFYLAAVMAQVMLPSYHATMLMEDSKLLPMAIFQCNWADQDKNFRKMCIFFMQHTQQPMTLTAMKLVLINMNTALNILKFSFSLYTLLGNMQFQK